MNFGVIGYGSIGKRHVNNLLKLGYEEVVLLRKVFQGNEFGLKELLEFDELMDTKPDAVIISNPTSLHATYLKPLLLNNVNVLVEKPLISSPEDFLLIQNKLEDYTGIGMTAYNMRFHPCVRFVKHLLSEKELGEIYSTRFFVGQYLPDWRPGTNYSKSYSASRKMGGGVLFDLIHEIDLACYLLGKPASQIVAKVDKVSDLHIETEDLAELLYHCENDCLISIHLDYLCREYKRYIEIIGEQGNLHVNLHTNHVALTTSNGKVETRSFPEFSWNDMYMDMMSVFITCLEEKSAPPISLQDGLISNKIAIDIRSKYYYGKE